MRVILVPVMTGDQFSQSIKLPMNGILDVKNTSGDTDNFSSDSKKCEEWPDWNEPEEPENQTVSMHIWPRAPCDAAEPHSTDLTAEAVVWEDHVPSSLGIQVSLGSTAPRTSGEQMSIPALPPVTEPAKPLKSSSPPKTSFVQSKEDPDEIKPPKGLSQERPLKVQSELGLGEEFTIQVKKKPVQDPELDWFADMIPEIKPSAAFLILPELKTDMMVPSKDDVSPVMHFSSKFAAAEMTEVRTSVGFNCVVSLRVFLTGPSLQ